MNSFSFSIKTKYIFGSGKLDTLGSQKLPGKKALILISSGKSVKENGSLEKVQNQLAEAGIDYVIFNKVVENPLKDDCMEGAAFAKENGCEFIVALGGGAVLDSAKAISAMTANPGDLWSYIGTGEGGREKLQNAGLPIIAIPTTSGTGSELNAWGVISNPETGEKSAFGGHPSLIPVITIVDPQLMVSVPKKYTAYQGMDIFFHNAENILGKNCNPFVEAVSYDSLSRVAKYLPLAFEDGNNLEAREQLAYASSITGAALQQCSLTIPHAAEHALSAKNRGIAHGAGLIMLGKAYFTKAAESGACNEKLIKMARAMGRNAADDPMDFVAEYEKLVAACGMDKLRLSDFDIKEEDLDDIAMNARVMSPGNLMANPWRVTVDDIADILKESL